MKEERKEKREDIYDRVQIKHDMSQKDTRKALEIFVGQGKEVEERHPKPLNIPTY